jgi:hypothetical protein
VLDEFARLSDDGRLALSFDIALCRLRALSSCNCLSQSIVANYLLSFNASYPVNQQIRVISTTCITVSFIIDTFIGYRPLVTHNHKHSQ